jgi:eukaryotic-like serine/threonine-protein kinase
MSEGGASLLPRDRRPAWMARAQTWLVPPLPPDLEEPFARESAESNRLRILLVAPFVLLGHIIHVAIYRTSPAERATLLPPVAEWRGAVAVVHTVTFAIALPLALLILHDRRGRASRFLAPAITLVYLLHGAATAGVDQLSATVTGVAPFIAYCLFMAAFVTLTPRIAALLYGVAAAAFFVAVAAAQRSPSVRLALMPNGGSIVVVSLVLSWLFYGARRRDFGQRAIIERQRESLAALNTGLERRVDEQVSEIVKRAQEVEQLNAQLRERVRARSSELSIALAKLAQDREIDGSLRRGVLLGDRFEVGNVIGQGGMGVVYEGIDRTTSARVAIKVIQAGSSQQLAALRRFLREAKACATVAHPAIVRVLHVDVSDDGMFFQVQELIDGRPLRTGGHAWEPGVVARFGSVLCDGLAAAHDLGIVHRDVKPSNVLLTRTAPGMKLFDFGIAKLYEEGHSLEEADGTHTGVILGTPAFMSPEQVEGMRAVTAASDVYAAGLILFLLLTGKHPFDGERTLHGIVYSHLCVPAPDARTLLPSVPEALAELVSRCLEKDPILRPSARDLGRKLAAVADEQQVPALEVLTRVEPLTTVPKAEEASTVQA